MQVVSMNTNGMKNDIDINAIYVKNMDPTQYTDDKQIELDRLHILVKKHEKSLVQADGTVNAHDLLSI
jgi:hypothetical protein